MVQDDPSVTWTVTRIPLVQTPRSRIARSKRSRTTSSVSARWHRRPTLPDEHSQRKSSRSEHGADPDHELEHDEGACGDEHVVLEPACVRTGLD